MDLQEPSRSAHSPVAPFVVYVVVFFIAWSVLWVRGVYPWAVRHLGDTTLANALINLAFRFAIWVLPVFVYLRRLDHVNPIEYLQLRLHWKRGLAVGVVLSGVNFMLTIWRFGLPNLHAANVTWNSILGTSILIGFFEEVPFRGFMLQKLEESLAFWIAATISSVLFVGIHIPGWALLGTLKASNIAFIFVFGMIMAIVFKFSRSLWAPIVAHSLNDFISGVLFHG
jgi:membrane protease YdiL (CAAX protease family)